MNDLTLFVSHIAGPIMLAIGLGMLLNNKHYAVFYKQMSKEPLALFTVAIMTMLMGLLLVLNHNLWGTAAEIIVSLFGWGALIKGLFLLIMPGSVDSFAKNLPLAKMLPFSSIFAIALGGYLSYVAYFA